MTVVGDSVALFDYLLTHHHLAGKVLERESPVFDDFIAKHKITTIPATRSIILVDIHQVGSSCGYSVPFYEFKDFRKTLNQVFEKREKDLLKGDEDKTMAR